MNLKATFDVSHSSIQPEKYGTEFDDDIDGDSDNDDNEEEVGEEDDEDAGGDVDVVIDDGKNNDDKDEHHPIHPMDLALSIHLSGSEDDDNDETCYGSPLSYYPSSQRDGLQVYLGSDDSDDSNDTNYGINDTINQVCLGSNASDNEDDTNYGINDIMNQNWSASIVGNKIRFKNPNNMKSQQQQLQQDDEVSDNLQVNNCMVPLATLADNSPLIHYYQEMCKLNVDCINSHKGIVGDKARIQRTSKVGNVNPVPHSLRSAAIAAVKQFIPSIEDDPQSQSLIKSVTRAAARMCPPLDDKSNFSDYEAAIGKICQQIKQIFPQRALFNLMSRWARRSKNHFQRDAINVVRVLSDQMGMSSVQFLDRARTWEHSPPTNTRKFMMLSYVRLKDNEVEYDSVVGQMHVSCMMMDSSLRGAYVFGVVFYLLVTTFVSFY